MPQPFLHNKYPPLSMQLGQIISASNCKITGTVFAVSVNNDKVHLSSWLLLSGLKQNRAKHAKNLGKILHRRTPRIDLLPSFKVYSSLDFKGAFTYYIIMEGGRGIIGSAYF